LGGLGVRRGDFGEFMFLGDAFETFILPSDPILEAYAFKRHDLQDFAGNGFGPISGALQKASSLADAEAVSSHKAAFLGSRRSHRAFRSEQRRLDRRQFDGKA
jgi:hypothetical protein